MNRMNQSESREGTMQDTMSRRNYPDPTSIEEAEQFRKELVNTVQIMQDQLGNRNRTEGDAAQGASRQASHDYWQWRRRAAGALRHRLADLRRMKEWIREFHESRQRREGAIPLPDQTGMDLILSQAKVAFGNMMSCMDTLQKRCLKLEAENSKLREELGLSPDEEV